MILIGYIIHEKSTKIQNNCLFNRNNVQNLHIVAVFRQIVYGRRKFCVRILQGSYQIL